MMIGVEFVEDKKTKQPLNPNAFGNILEQCKNSGVLFGIGGFKGNVRMFFFIYLNFYFRLFIKLN